MKLSLLIAVLALSGCDFGTRTSSADANSETKPPPLLVEGMLHDDCEVTGVCKSTPLAYGEALMRDALSEDTDLLMQAVFNSARHDGFVFDSQLVAWNGRWALAAQDLRHSKRFLIAPFQFKGQTFVAVAAAPLGGELRPTTQTLVFGPAEIPGARTAVVTALYRELGGKGEWKKGTGALRSEMRALKRFLDQRAGR